MNRVKKVFQVWIEDPDPPSVTLLGYMEGIINMIPDNCNYQLVSTSNYFPGNPKVTWTDIAGVISSLREDYPEIDAIWDSLIVQHKSDIIRIYLSISGDNCMYIDCDIEMVSWPVIKFRDYPYFIRLTPGGELIDQSVFFNNNQLQYFTNILDDIVSIIDTELDYRSINDIIQRYSLLNKRRLFDLEVFVHHKED